MEECKNALINTVCKMLRIVGADMSHKHVGTWAGTCKGVVISVEKSVGINVGTSVDQEQMLV